MPVQPGFNWNAAEGDTTTGSGGQAFVFHGGEWEVAPPAPATPTPAAPAPQDNVSRVRAEIEAQFPWIKLMGLSVDWFRAEVAGVASSDQIVADIRNTPQWKRATAGIQRADGTLRSSEAEYFNTVENYRKVQAQWARYSGYTPDLDNPEYYRSFFENEIDPNELTQRYQTYDTIVQGGQDVKDAFFVYANMNVSDDDLYQAVVNPEYGQSMQDEYNRNVAGGVLDYQTWITRATQAGLNRVADQLGKLQTTGALTGAAVSATLQTDPDFARQMMDVLFHGGNIAETRTLTLPELMNSFEYAMVGSAATANGLAMPTQERVAALRQAGIDRAKALENYGAFGSNKDLLAGMAQRAAGRDFTQDDFEKAVFLHTSDASNLLTQSYAVEKAAGGQRSNFGFSQTKQGRLQQPGLGTLY